MEGRLAIFIFQSSPEIGFTLPIALQSLGRLGGDCLGCPGVGLARSVPQGGLHEAPESDEGGGGIAGEAEVESIALGGEGEGFAGFDRDFADVNIGTEFFE
ncbi:MAG: hypothetical protein RLZZ511_3274 [Cyanobacteriota bacterium]